MKSMITLLAFSVSAYAYAASTNMEALTTEILAQSEGKTACIATFSSTYTPGYPDRSGSTLTCDGVRSVDQIVKPALLDIEGMTLIAKALLEKGFSPGSCQSSTEDKLPTYKSYETRCWFYRK